MKPNPFLSNRPCVYGIRNTTNGKIYVGRTKCLWVRANQYVYDFRERSIGHINDYLYSAMSKVGIENFEIFPLEFCSAASLPEREMWWIIHLGSNDRNRGYNLRLDVDGSMVTSAETSEKISSNLKKQWAAGERDNHSEKLRNAWVGRDDWRETAGNTLRRSITKWQYDVTMPNGDIEEGVLYADLKSLGIEGVMSNFHRSAVNTVRHKNHTIRRYPFGEKDL